MVRYGKGLIYREKLTFPGKVGFWIFGNPHFASFLACLNLKKFIADKTFEKILDAGCGNGEFSFFLAKKCPEAEIYACDIKSEHIDMCKRVQEKLGLKNIDFYVDDLVNMNGSRKYDLVVSILVLIYMNQEETKKILNNMYSSTGNGGFLYLCVPERNWENVGRIGRKHYKNRLKETHEEISGYLYSKEELVKELESIGYKVLKAKNIIGFFGKLAWDLEQVFLEKNRFRLRLLMLPFLKLLGYMDRFVDNRKGAALMVVAQKV